MLLIFKYGRGDRCVARISSNRDRSAEKERSSSRPYRLLVSLLSALAPVYDTSVYEYTLPRNVRAYLMHVAFAAAPVRALLRRSSSVLRPQIVLVYHHSHRLAWDISPTSHRSKVTFDARERGTNRVRSGVVRVEIKPTVNPLRGTTFIKRSFSSWQVPAVLY